MDPWIGMMLSLFVLAFLLGYGWVSYRTRVARRRLKCVRPAMVDLGLRRDGRTRVVVRVLLSCYLNTQKADRVWIKHVRLCLKWQGGSATIPWTAATSSDGRRYPISAGYQLDQSETVHALIEFSVDDADLVAKLRMPGVKAKGDLQMLEDNARHYRRVASVRFVTTHRLQIDSGWSAAEVR